MLEFEMRCMIKEGWEISWFTTNKDSFDWTDINTNIEKFIEKSNSLDFEYVDIGYFHPNKKKTVYQCYELVKDEM